MKEDSLRPTLHSLAMAVAVAALSSQVAQAVPYASGVTRNGNTVSFVLNQDAQGLVVLRNGANPVYPGTNAGTLSFDMTGFTSYQIIVTGNTAKAWTKLVADGTDRNFYLACGVSINKNPASTNFGKVYISESQGGKTGAGRTTSDGIYVLRADGTADGDVKTGGVSWTTDGSYASSPLRSTIGPDDHLYVADYYDDLAFEFNDDMSVATQLIDAANKTGGSSDYQGVGSIWVEGTQAAGNRKIYTVNYNYNDPNRKGLIMYDLGSNPTAIGLGTGTQIIGPTYYTFYPYDVARDSQGYWYINQYRATAGQAPAISKFDGSVVPNNSPVWETANTYTYTWGLDLYEAGGQVAVGQYSGGNVYIFDTATGAFIESFSAGSRPRELAFDAAGNIVTVDSNQEYARFWSPGGYTVATTKSDGTFTIVKPSINVSVAASPDTTSMDLNQPAGAFTFTRTGDIGLALPVGYTLTGTATNGIQYQLLSGTATFPAGSSSVTVPVTAKPFSPAGPTRSVILSLNNSNTYSPAAPASATVWIVDTNKPLITIAARDAQFYERTNDLARFTLTRLGDTNVYLSQVNVTYAGTASQGTQFFGDAFATMSYGDETKDVFVYPIHDGVVTGPLTVTASVAAAGDGSYAVGTPSTNNAVTRVDADGLPETVLFADNFDTDNSANWTARFAARNGVDDYSVTWAYDYLIDGGIPPAPHSPSGSTLGLKMTVNKSDATAGGAAGLNLYPKGKQFSGNYALRFDMYLKVGGTSYTTEYALCGINHSGSQTNWFRGPSTSNNPNDGVGSTWTYDGLWASIEADASGIDDYMILSAPATAPAGIWGPTTYATTGATPFTGLFKSPPFYYGGVGGGSPANPDGSSTPIWVDVELSQIGNIVTLKIDKAVILSYTNTVAASSGNIMIGYDDAYDSIMPGDSSVIIDNLRVISLAVPVIGKIVKNAGNLEITFSANAGDVPAQFTLQQSSPLASGTYADTSSTITSLGGGAFKAVKVAGNSPTFYRVRRIY